MHKSAVACTWISVGTIMSCTLADRGHGISYEGLVYPGIRLHVRGRDLGMLSKVPFEGFALPSSFGFDYIKGNPLEQVLQGGTNSDSMSGELQQIVLGDDFVDPCEEDGSCHRPHVVLVFEGEEITFSWGVVNLDVVCEGTLWVDDPGLLCPEDIFALLLGDFGPREEDDCLFKVIPVSYVMLHIRDFDMDGGVKAIQLHDCNFSQMSLGARGPGNQRKHLEYIVGSG